MDERTAVAFRLLDSPEDELYLEIGRHLQDESAVRLPPRTSKLIELAKRWFNSKREELAKVVCADPHLKALSKPDVQTHEKVMLVCSLLDINSHLLGGVPVITVAALIVRLGLHEFCAPTWGKQELAAQSSSAHLGES